MTNVNNVDVVRDRCFICLGNDNLKISNIHCGRTVYHTRCIDEYCRQNDNILCPICSTDITDKFSIKHTRKCSPMCSCDYNACMKAVRNCFSQNEECIGAFVFSLILLIIIMSFVVFHMIDKTPLWNEFIILLFVKLCSIILAMICGCQNDLAIVCWVDMICSLVLLTSSLLIMSCISISHPNVLSPHTIIKIFNILFIIALCSIPFIIICSIVAYFGHGIYCICCNARDDGCTMCTISCCTEESTFVVATANNV